MQGLFLLFINIILQVEVFLQSPVNKLREENLTATVAEENKILKLKQKVLKAQADEGN